MRIPLLDYRLAVRAARDRFPLLVFGVDMCAFSSSPATLASSAFFSSAVVSLRDKCSARIIKTDFVFFLGAFPPLCRLRQNLGIDPVWSLVFQGLGGKPEWWSQIRGRLIKSLVPSGGNAGGHPGRGNCRGWRIHGRQDCPWFISATGKKKPGPKIWSRPVWSGSGALGRF